ncbi:putative Heterokaryon incompatibility domain-containing protein [Seiridium cardinale]
MPFANATSMLVQESVRDGIPNCVILPHRWEEEDASFREWSKATKQGSLAADASIKAREGFKKLTSLASPHFTELQEANQSMYRWIANSHLYYAYPPDGSGKSEDDHGAKGDTIPETFEPFDWFGRGRTLQEPVTPIQVVF